jgi:hypothetical protein
MNTGECLPAVRPAAELGAEVAVELLVASAGGSVLLQTLELLSTLGETSTETVHRVSLISNQNLESNCSAPCCFLCRQLRPIVGEL